VCFQAAGRELFPGKECFQAAGRELFSGKECFQAAGRELFPGKEDYQTAGTGFLRGLPVRLHGAPYVVGNPTTIAGAP